MEACRQALQKGVVFVNDNLLNDLFGDASAIANAVHTIPPGFHMALSHVPSASHAYEVLKQHLSLYAGSGGAGTTAASGAAAAIGHGLHVGLGK